MSGGEVLYLSGKITGQPNYKALFDQAEEVLREAGYGVINPTRLGERDGFTWQDYMKSALVDIACCDGVATLNNWVESKGARIEVNLAWDLGIPVRSVIGWASVRV